jgi:DNA-binding XRE family transcriptional regulator
VTVRFQTTSTGEVAILPRAEYERLIARADANEAKEDTGTARLVARAKKEIAEGMPLLPKETVDRLANGENPIRVLREFRNETQMELRMRVGITQGYLSDLETGKRKGPLALHQKIARALGVPLELLAPIAVSDEEANPALFKYRGRARAETKAQRRRR